MNSKALKDHVKNMAKKRGIDPQALMQNYFLERILERIAHSPYKDKMILKGGMLIASMIGIDQRTTRDMDTTVQGYPATEEDIRTMLQDIIEIPLDDHVSFEIQSFKDIRKEDKYAGFRIVILCVFEKIQQHIKIDISTGDKLTPSEIEYSYMPLFSDQAITIQAYNLETIMAEKIETVLSRGESNTRMRDFYDVHILCALRFEEIDIATLKKALVNTSQRRDSVYIFENLEDIKEILYNSKTLEERWQIYQNEYAYASEINFSDIIESFERMVNVAI